MNTLQSLFPAILNMSITASYVAVGVILCPICSPSLKRAGKPDLKGISWRDCAGRF